MDGTGITRRLLRGRLGRCCVAAAGGAAMILTLGAAAVPAAHPGAVTDVKGALSGVSAVSATDAWAVGSNGAAQNMILHWDGTSWAKAAVPATTNAIPQAVSADSADDAWAVGLTSGGTSSTMLVLHWDGTSWATVATPATGKPFNALNGVSAVSATDVWAVGDYGTLTVTKSLALHWNGSTWAQTPLPPLHGIYLSSVDALSASDVWAAGEYGAADAPKSLVLHWDGTGWSVVSSPHVGLLHGVSALSATGAWAVGGGHRSVVLQCGAASCTRVASPNPGTVGSPSFRFRSLSGVTALSPSDAWAVGSYGGFLDGGKTQVSKTFVVHWNGTSWTQVASPSVGRVSDLSGVTATSASQAWAAGQTGHHVLILDWNGTTWTQS
jgi:hypothetical protein